MGWFKSGIDDRVKTLVAETVAAYIERAQLSYQLLTLDPILTDIEMAVTWAAAGVVWENARSERTSSDENLKVADEVTWEFFITFCQNYISEVCRSTLKLDPDSEVIRTSITPTLESMPQDRLNRSGKLGAALLNNAQRLAVATISIVSAQLSRDQAQAGPIRRLFSCKGGESESL